MPFLQFLAETGTGTGDVTKAFGTVLEMAGTALTWILDNPVMLIIFVCGLAAPVFKVIKKGRKAVGG